MAKSQLEIVLIDEGEAATQPAGPSQESVAAASATVPAREREASRTAVETPIQPAPERQSKREESAESKPTQSRERQDTTAVDVAGRVAQMTARAFGLGGLVSEIQNWQQTLREVGGLFKGAASGVSESSPASRRAKEEADHPTPTKAAAPDKSEAKPTRAGTAETFETDDNAIIASVKNFVRVTAPKAFSDFTNGAIDTLRTFMAGGGEGGGEGPSTTAIARSPVTTSAPDDRQQTIKVEVPKSKDEPRTSIPIPKVERPDDSRGWPGLHFNRRPVVSAPTAPPVIVRQTSAPVPTAPVTPVVPPTTAPMSGVAAWTSAAAPAARAAATTSAPAVAATTAPVAATAVPATAGSTAAAVGAAGAVATAAPATGGVASVAAALGPVGIAAIAVTAAFAGLAIGTKKLSSFLAEEAQKLAGYSSQTAAATAESEIRQEHAMMARASRIGPQMAQFERFRGKTDERLADIGTSIQGLMLTYMNKMEPFIDKTISALEFVTAELPVMAKMLELIVDYQRGFTAWPEAWRDLKDMVKLQANANKEFAELVGILKEGEQDPLVNDFLTMFEGIGDAAATRLGMPHARLRAPRPGGQ